MVKAVISPDNAAYFPAPVTNRGIRPLHHGGNVGFIQAQQEQVTIIHVVVGQFLVQPANVRNKPWQMLLNSIAQIQKLFFAERIVLVNQIIRLRLELLFVSDPNNVFADGVVYECSIVIGDT